MATGPHSQLDVEVESHAAPAVSSRSNKKGSKPWTSEFEAPLRDLILLSRLLTVARKPHQPGGVPPQSCIASNQSRTWSRWDRSTELDQLLNDTEGNKHY